MQSELRYCVKRMLLAAPSPVGDQTLDPAGLKKTISSDTSFEKCLQGEEWRRNNKSSG